MIRPDLVVYGTVKKERKLVQEINPHSKMVKISSISNVKILISNDVDEIPLPHSANQDQNEDQLEEEREVRKNEVQPVNEIDGEERSKALINSS